MRLWYVTTAVHLWRFYFKFKDKDRTNLSDPSRLNYEACDRAIRIFTDAEVSILNQYYSTSYGNYDDLKFVNDFSSMNDVRKKQIWDLIKRANYEVIVERGLMDRKEVIDNAVLQRDNPGV